MDMKVYKIGFLFGAFCGIAFMSAVAYSQQSTPGDPQELQLTVNLTEQALANANHQFIAERTQTLILRNQLAGAQADVGKRDKEIADLKSQLAKAAAAAPPANATPVPPHSQDPEHTLLGVPPQGGESTK